MSDSVQMTGIEFEIKGTSDKATNSIASLIKSLTALRASLTEVGKAAKGSGSLKELAGSIKELNEALKGGYERYNKFATGMSNIAAAAELLGEKVKYISELANSMTVLSNAKVSGAAFKNLSDGMAAVGFATKYISKEALDNLERMANALQKLSGVDLKGLGSAMKGVAKGGSAPATPISQDIQDVINKGDKLDLLKLKLDALKTSLSNAFAKGDLQGAVRIRQQIASVEAEIEKLEEQAKKPSGFAIFREAIARIGETLDSVRQRISSFTSAIKSIASGIKSVIVGAVTAVSSVVNSVLNGLKTAASGAKKIVTPFAKAMMAPLKSLYLSASKLAKSIGGVFSRFKRIAGYRILRTAIKLVTQGFSEGTKNLYEWSRALGGATNVQGKTFAQSMDQIATSMLYLKNSIGAAVGPLISALAPAIDFLVDKIVTLLNLINQLIAKLTGASSWNKAKKKATEYGDAVSGAGQAAKEAMLYLAPFDELNVLPDDRDRGSGGGGAAEDYSDMFEEVSEFNEAIANFADSIKEKVNAGDWQGLGELLGGKVNELVEKIDFAGAGAKVGTGINAWFTTKYWTLETINFQNIGSKIALFLNNAMEGINFETIGRTVTQKFTILGDLVIGAVENINWKSVGSSIGGIIRGAFDQLGEWINGVNWAEFGQTVFTSVKDALEGLDFPAIVRSFFSLLGSAMGALDQLSSVINGINWQELGSNLYTSFKDMVEDIDFETIAKSLFSFFGSAIGAAAGVLSGVVQGVISDIKNYFLQFINDENNDGNFGAGEIIKGVYQGIKNAILNIGSWIKENIFDPFITGFKNAFGIHSPAEAMDEPGQMIGEGILEGILKPFKEINAWVKEHIVDPLSEAIKEKIEEAKELVNIGLDIMSNMLKGIQDGWTLIKAWFSDNFVRGMQQFGIDAVNGLLEHVEGAVNGAIDTINGMIDKLPPSVQEWMGLEHIDPIEIKMIPDLDPPVGTFYNETKAKIEQESKTKPTSISSTANLTGTKSSLTDAQRTVSAWVKYDAVKRGAIYNSNNQGARTISVLARYDAVKRGAIYNSNNQGARTISVWARYDASKNGLLYSNNNQRARTISTWARYDAVKRGAIFNSNNQGARTISTWARYDATKNNLSNGQRTISSTARFDSYSKNFNSATVNNNKVTPKIDAEAHFVDTRIDYTPTIDVNANIRSHNQDVEYYYKNGGIVGANGPIPITRFASGGGYANNHGQMFIAREAGPELVGTLGGHTAVMNNDQIVASVSAGVARAIAGIRFHMTGLSSAPPVSTESEVSEESIYRAMVRALNDADVFPDTIDLDGDVVYRKMVQRNRRERTRLGVNPMMAT